jgi:hypothetical protein
MDVCDGTIIIYVFQQNIHLKEGKKQWKIPATLTRKVPEIFRLVVQYLNQLRHCVPSVVLTSEKMLALLSYWLYWIDWRVP